MKIGLIGVGTIGKFLLEKLNEEQMIPGYQITAIFDERSQSLDKLKTLVSTYELQQFHEMDDFLTSSIDVVIECANVAVVEKYASQIIKQKDLLLISVGALANQDLYKSLQSIAISNNHKIYLASGAIGGLDILRSARVLNGLDTVELTTRKPIQALSVENLDEEMTLFAGSAKEAIAKFPQNANISIIISLAGIGVEQTSVKIIADPTVDKNVHTLQASGDFGTLRLTLENNPSPDNPKTSYLTGLSILSTLRTLDKAIIIG